MGKGSRTRAQRKGKDEKKSEGQKNKSQITPMIDEPVFLYHYHRKEDIFLWLNMAFDVDILQSDGVIRNNLHSMVDNEFMPLIKELKKKQNLPQNKKQRKALEKDNKIHPYYKEGKSRAWIARKLNISEAEVKNSIDRIQKERPKHVLKKKMPNGEWQEIDPCGREFIVAETNNPAPIDPEFLKKIQSKIKSWE